MSEANERRDGFVNRWNSVYFFIPLFENPVTMPQTEVFRKALAQEFGNVEVLGQFETPQKPGDLAGFLLHDYPVYYEKDQLNAPSQLVVYGADAFDKSQWDDMVTAQFWDCPEKDTFMPRCNYSILCSNLMAAGLPRLEQYGIMWRYAQAMLKLFPDCIGIYWPHSQKLLSRKRMSEPGWNSENLYFLDGGLNVRFFNISGTDGEMVFDTMGLVSIGLPDLQVHCKNLEPNDVVMFLRNLAAYLYQEGDIIEDGNTVEGIDGGKWRCQREASLILPERPVLDIHAGQFAGGNR